MTLRVKGRRRESFIWMFCLWTMAPCLSTCLCIFWNERCVCLRRLLIPFAMTASLLLWSQYRKEVEETLRNLGKSGEEGVDFFSIIICYEGKGRRVCFTIYRWYTVVMIICCHFSREESKEGNETQFSRWTKGGINRGHVSRYSYFHVTFY